MHKVVLGDPCHYNKTLFNNYLPLNISLLAAYAKNALSKQIDIKLFKSTKEILAYIKTAKPEVVALSAYLWNTRLALEILRYYKELCPDGISVLGGPNFPQKPEKLQDWLANHWWVDFIIDGEGEVALFNLLSNLEAVGFEVKQARRAKVPGCLFLDEHGALIHEPEALLSTLDDIPSPYLQGWLDPFLLNGSDGVKLVPLFESSRGCPFHCSFCRNSTIGNEVRFFTPERFLSEIEYVAQFYQAHNLTPGPIMITDQNFGQFAQDLEVARGLAKIADKFGFPQNVMVTTGKGNARNVLKTIQAFPALYMSLSVQSFDPEVLQNIRRKNFPLEEFKKYEIQARAMGRLTASEIILGLPGDSLAKHLNTLRTLLSNDFDIINPFSFMMLPGTPAESDEARQKYEYKTRWRLIPGGHSEIEGHGVFESEEIVVATKTMSLADYIYLRRIHLLILTLFTGGIFRALKRLLEENNIDLIEYVKQFDELTQRKDANSKIGDILKEFSEKCYNELFDSHEELFNYYESQYSNLSKGMIGENLLQKYRYLLYSFMSELVELIIINTTAILNRADCVPLIDYQGIFELIRVQGACIKTLMENSLQAAPHPKKFLMSHDVPQWLANGASKLTDYKFKTPREFTAGYSDDKLRYLQSLSSYFENDPEARGKMLHRTGMVNLLPEIVSVT